LIFQEQNEPIVDPRTDCQGEEVSRAITATLHTWRQVRSQLSPVIGHQGFKVLYLRSVHLTCASFPWLAEAGEEVDPLDKLAKQMERETPEQAVQAGRAMLATFTGLVSVLIGESLTAHLLSGIGWDPISDTSPPELPK
jgi:hypothetical protein